MQDKHIEGIENPKRVYQLEDFVMSDVAAPSSTPVLFVDHGIRIGGQEFISLAKISDLEALVKSAQLATLERLMENGHGGGNWRRLITLEIDRIGGKNG